MGFRSQKKKMVSPQNGETRGGPPPPLCPPSYTTDQYYVQLKLDGSLQANPMNDLRIANAVTLKSTFCLP